MFFIQIFIHCLLTREEEIHFPLIFPLLCQIQDLNTSPNKIMSAKHKYGSTHLAREVKTIKMTKFEALFKMTKEPQPFLKLKKNPIFRLAI